jgi:Ca2+-binding RTX toxin-like protein
MSSRVIDTQELGQVLLDLFGRYLVVLPGFSLRFSGETVIASADYNRITNQGFIVSVSENALGTFDAVSMIGTNGTLDNAGSIVGLDYNGVELGAGNSVSNRGTIFGATSGIRVTGDSASIVNSGTIDGGVFGVLRSAGDFMRVLNTGLILGESAGISGDILSVAGSRIENSGTIAGAFGIAINIGAGEDEVLNSGTLMGEVRLYDGNDLYDGRLGRVTGLVDGGGGDDTILGGAGAETLRGGNHDDEILGAGGNDVIEGGAGGDLLDGGEGFDIASYGSDSAGVLVDLQNAALNQGDAADDALLNFEGVFGGLGADTLRGNTASNELRGGDGNDVLDGRAGLDTMRGGFGNDLMMVDNAGDRIVEGIGLGADTVMSAVTYRLAPNAEVEFLTTLDAAGLTAINLTGSNTANTILGNAGANRLTGLGGADSLSGLAGADLLYGGTGNDTLIGGTEDDQLFGDAGADSLDGGDGIDRLAGGDGNDRMTGGAGRDIFIFDTAVGLDLNTFTPINVDTITDFNPVDDTIRLSLSVFTTLGATGALAADAFLSVAGGQATLPSHRIIYDPLTGIVWSDFNGSGFSIPARIAVLENLPANVTAADFVVIA